MYRKVCSTLLSISLIVPFFSPTAVLATSVEAKPSSAAINFVDMNGHWANSAVAKFAHAGIVTGYDDQAFHPDEPVTRAEFVTFLNRVFRYEGNGPSSFTDVKPSDWYMDSVSKATQAGLIEGYPDGRFLPNERILRQDAVLLLTRAFQISSDTHDSISRFHDAAEIDDYAQSAMASLISAGYLTGGDGQSLQPKRAITRAETVELLNRIIGWMSPDFGDIKTSEINGNVIVNRPGTKLQDVKIDGNLYVAEGVGEGEVTFGNIMVAGDTLIKGGGAHSVIFNKSLLSRVVLSKKNNLVRVALNDSSSANVVEVNHPSIVELSSGSTVKEVRIGEAAYGSKIVNKGTIGHLKVGADGVTVNGQPVSKGDDLKLPEKPGVVPGSPSGSSSSSSNSSQDDPWQLVWNDEFNGSTVDAGKWNVQDTGTVYNNELEYYSPNNVSLAKDGDKNVLVLEAKKESHSGRNYTSGKLTSQKKGDWTYGKFEVRAKLPVQQGMWPAIWMMPTDEHNQYGPWPGSGEIDIMELTGPVETDPANADVYPRRVQGTIHYGNPHEQQYNHYLLPQGQTFADDYHVFSVEWLPGKISWFVDGHKFHETSDWGSRGDGQAEYYTYPAPFDRPFYMILNLAVGGDMPGNPKGDFNSDKMYVDYVRVYKYNDLDKWPDVTGKRPESSGNSTPQRAPMPDGNQIWNHKFDGGTDNSGVPLMWQFLKNVNGDGNVSIVQDPVKGKAAKVEVTNAGDQLYSIQLTQMPLMLEKGKAYEVTFDAKAEAPRSIMSKLTQYQGSWTAYSGEVTKQLTDQWETYRYSFNMKSKSDNNARFEFNLGKTSTASAYFTNVKVVEIPWIPEPQEERKPLSDGNLIFNGGFDQGSDRMAFWNLTKDAGAVASASVSNDLVQSTYMMDRKLNVTASNGGTVTESVYLSQSGLVLSKGAAYTLTFDAKAEHNRSIGIGLETGVSSGVTITGGSTVNLTNAMTTYTKHFTVNETNDDSTLKFLLGGDKGTFVLDNVRLIKRNNPPTVNDYAHIPADQYWEMQGTTLVASGEGGKEVTGMSPGNYADYKISIVQPGRYVPSVRVSSVEDDSVLNFTVLDESLHAVKTASVAVGNTEDGQSYKTIYLEPFDLQAGTYYLRLSGQDYDTVWIDLSREMIQNGDFSSKDTNGWTLLKNSVDPGVQASTMSAAKGELSVNIGGPGANDWDVQVKQAVNKALMKGKTYRLSFDASASVPRNMKGVAQLNGAPYTNYMEQTVSLATYKQHFEKVFSMTADDPDAVFQFSLGKLGDISVSHSVYLDNVSLVQIMSQKANLFPNGDFSSGITGWTIFSQDTGQLAISNDNGALRADVGTVGTESWHRQVYYEGIGYKNGNQYTLSFKARSTIPRKMNISIGWIDAAHNYEWHGYGSKIIDLGTADQTYTFTFVDDKDTTDKGRVSFELGHIAGGNAGNLSVFIDDIFLVNDGAIAP
ncbi:carbohydrate binding domain-containing protein [Paenibacillus sedimenti]|uniref:Carbohydrate binding domain-containing protein n=1 Tax=Paenibacillus sedimenti TaxID=2770274 RepID=A0A926KWJ3_9BACL|nr:carbohydrate binding domain-containing protein [Paenibacillus sedimenti]MBD0384466.1 carbohydrate binding domain-containing protein [Paenibacillus sedimenti]